MTESNVAWVRGETVAHPVPKRLSDIWRVRQSRFYTFGINGVGWWLVDRITGERCVWSQLRADYLERLGLNVDASHRTIVNRLIAYRRRPR